MRLLFVTLGSIVLTTLVVGNAYHQKKQFYPSVVFLTKSNPSMAILYLQALVLIVLFGKMLRKFFFGQLRTAEMEHLIERSWYAVTETCLAFTVFRDDFSPKFVAMFTLLLFLKSFHWLAEDRVDYMERSPVISLIFHLRVISLLSLLSMLDMYFIQHAYHSTLTKGASVQLVFGFEYAILLTVILMILVKYLLHAIDLQSENPWDNKAVYLLYTDLLMGLIKVMLYMMFVAIMIKVHTFPLFVIRPMYLTMRSFKKALHDVVMSRRAIRNMNTLYPDATPEELQSSDNVCIICREEMVSGCKKLPCSHIFHTSCLRSWFQRQQTCPTCRMDILRTPAPRRPQAPFIPQAQQPMFNQNVFAGFPMWAPFAPPPPGAMPPPPPPPATGDGRAPPTSTQAQTASAQQGATSGPSGQPGSGTTAVSGTATTTTATAAGGFAPAFMPGAFPGALPGFPFGFPNPSTTTAGGMPPINPFMPYGLLRPPVPPSFAGLTDAEVRAMEGQERQNVEARVTCLRNIQTLLDAAVLQMQQYTAVINSLSISTSTSIAPTESPSSTTQARSESLPKSSTSTGTKMSTEVSESNSLQESNMQPSTSSQPDSIATDSVAQDSASLLDTLSNTVSEEQTPGLKSDDEELNEIRRRRLERFTGKNDDVSSPVPQTEES